MTRLACLMFCNNIAKHLINLLPQKQDEVGDFGPSAATWRTGQNIHAMFHSGQLAPLCENMTSTTKPEVHNVLH